MSKQDGYASRTAADLERKYNFGQTFADIYGLASDARKIAEEAESAFKGLNQEQIFNLLTNFGESKGIYRDDAGGVYVNASYIKSGTISGDNVKVAAATVTGELTAATIKADKISGGELDFNKVKANGLEVTLGQISDLSSLRIQADIISGGTLSAINISGSMIRGSRFIATSDISADFTNCFTVEDGKGHTVGHIGYSYDDEDNVDKLWIKTVESQWNPAIKLSAYGNISIESDFEMVYISAPEQVQMVADEVRIKVGTTTWVFRDDELLKDGVAVL